MVTKQEIDDAQRRLEAEMQAEAFLELLTRRYGIELDDIPKYVEAVRWSMEHRNHISRLVWAVILGLVALSVTGAVHALMEGIKNWAQK